MRALVDIPEPHLQALDAVAKEREQSRAAVIREAVADFLARHQRRQSTQAFGLWNRPEQDGLAYQESLRGEW